MAGYVGCVAWRPTDRGGAARALWARVRRSRARGAARGARVHIALLMRRG